MNKRNSSFNQNKLPIIICGSAIGVGIISFFITLSLYDVSPNNSIDNNNILISQVEKEVELEKNIIEIVDKEENIVKEDIYTAISVSLNDEEIENEEEELLEVDFEVIPTVAEVSKNDEIIETDKNSESLFDYPLSGEIGLNYSMEKLIYSKTLDEWITHNGVDILGKEADVVKAIADGMVESIKMDPRYGNTIIIDHGNGYKSIYSNLSTNDLVFVGQKVKKGDIISGVGSGFGFESLEKPHIHFTILKDNEIIDPLSIID